MNRGAQPLAITHRQHRPYYESRPYRPAPGRREHIHGRIQPADVARKFSWWRLISFAVYAVCTLYAVKLWVVG